MEIVSCRKTVSIESSAAAGESLAYLQEVRDSGRFFGSLPFGLGNSQKNFRRAIAAVGGIAATPNRHWRLGRLVSFEK